jgi:hypothetical protein
MALCGVVFLAGCQTGQKSSGKSGGWVSLFDGQTLAGWKANENQGTFSVQDGMIVVKGRGATCFMWGR